ncbi:AtpZ/AtpI family protein [Erythrobacter sp. F6033]|uniref:AtpZ/AtpI family protein n=1 Tax=Erythrobacter sp. F6033 TaxID=2926401 RepID=UPI001FF18A59|nr:AtpZ/AtpI family protein [Erythrobacter sp. F6033]MCK0128113.1 AtpZ/AtpI family protein [Erythrobacter sp. F6033]
MSEEKPAREPIAEDARIDALEARLKAANEREEQRTKPKVKGADANYRSGNRVLADLLGGIIGGSVIGWAFDAIFGTLPWGLLVGLFFGIGVAFRNIIRAANNSSDGSDTGS